MNSTAKRAKTLPIWGIMTFPSFTPSYMPKARHEPHTLSYAASQGTKEIQHMLLVDLVEPIELPNHLIRF